ncbi:hypothetical protein ElyMa_003732500 [Elysia marginata]|uniref:Uncharacterized protein n=1 Tax=Elysia marginata TaxID=1093978 RepID=A0AAV4F6R1_9GAST|nr:hypothetical protein ElyMa_003732500 [Elysia marginata]
MLENCGKLVFECLMLLKIGLLGEMCKVLRLLSAVDDYNHNFMVMSKTSTARTTTATQQQQQQLPPLRQHLPLLGAATANPTKTVKMTRAFMVKLGRSLVDCQHSISLARN